MDIMYHMMTTVNTAIRYTGKVVMTINPKGSHHKEKFFSLYFFSLFKNYIYMRRWRLVEPIVVIFHNLIKLNHHVVCLKSTQ